MQYSCWKCMTREVDNPLVECSACLNMAWRKARHQLFHTSRQRGKVTTEGVHERWRAPEWMTEAATQGASLKELSWGWELRGAGGQKSIAKPDL
jgi:hypothetical protein